MLGLELVAQWDSEQPYLRTIVGFSDAALRIALLRLPKSSAERSGHHIELLEYRSPRGERTDPRTCNPGNVHVSFFVDDLDAAYAELSARGVRFKSARVEIDHGRNRGGKAVYLLDPDDITAGARPAGGRPMSALERFRLDSSIAIVTGGAGGLGAAITGGLAEAGAAVAVVDRDGARAKQVAETIGAHGARVLALETDVSSAASVEAMAAATEVALGPVDVLVNSAGITRRAPALEFMAADWQAILDVNLTGVFLACQAVGGRMAARRRGRIVNLASIAGEIGLPGTIAYCASKGGVGRVRSARREPR